MKLWNSIEITRC